MKAATPTLFIDAHKAAKMLGYATRSFRRRYVETGMLRPLLFGNRDKMKFLTADVERLKKERL
jgi:hypothetical protein